MTRKCFALIWALAFLGMTYQYGRADDAAPAEAEKPAAEAKPAVAEDAPASPPAEKPAPATPEAATTPEAKPAAQAAEAADGTRDVDWTYWRGPQMNGNSTAKNLPESWDPEGGEGSNLVWKREDLGSRSTPIAMNGRIYTLCRDKPETKEEGEKIVCVDAATGETVWEQRWNVYLSDVPDTRVAWSSVVGDPETGNVYALGVAGQFLCFNGESGELVWEHSLHEEYGLLSTYGGRTNFPIVFEDNVIVSAVIIGWGEQAKPTHRYIAFDKYNGQPVWFEGTTPFPEDTTYSAPVLGVFDGQAAMVTAAGDGKVWAFQPRTGKPLWNYQLSERGVNTSPLIHNGKVYAGHSEENPGRTEMGALACLDGATGKEVWKNYENFIGKSPPIIADDLLVAIEDGGKLMILDPETGKVLFDRKVDRMMRGSPLYADGKLYVLGTNGLWWIFKIKTEGEGENRKVDLEEIHKLRLNGEEVNGSLIVDDGRIYIPTSAALYCIAGPDAGKASDPLPELPVESPRNEDQTPALAQIVPVESLLFPGDRQPLDVRLYNARGQWIRNADPSEVTFTAEGTGSVDAKGVFSSEADSREHGACVITAKVGELSSTARLRVIPNLPWSFDFESNEVPVTWVGMRYRHIPLDVDLLQSINKADPMAGQLYIYFTTEFVNYAPTRTFDDTTPAQRWTELLRFLNLLAEGDKPKNLEEAKAKLDPSLQKLVDEKVLASFEWTTWDRTDSAGKTIKEPQLKVARGERTGEGNGVMCKITTIPKGTRSQGWTGHTLFHDYTIQADVYAPNKQGRLPDIGLVAQRYTFDLQGASQKLQIRTWPPQLRMAKTVDFTWEPETWYTMKFRAANEDGKAVLRGKVWKKGEEEPAEWHVTAEDTVPNKVGAPGFYGNSKDAEVFYDNVTVTPNEPLASQEGAGSQASGDE